MRDTNLIFNSNATITANTQSAIMDTSKWPNGGAWVEISQVAGVVQGTAPLLSAQVEYSDSASFAPPIEAGPEIVAKQATAGFVAAKLCQSQRRYARVKYTVFGTSPTFTGIYAALVSGPQRDAGPGVNSF